jgi:hypothetical protein
VSRAVVSVERTVRRCAVCLTEGKDGGCGVCKSAGVWGEGRSASVWGVGLGGGVWGVCRSASVWGIGRAVVSGECAVQGFAVCLTGGKDGGLGRV